MSFDSIPRPIRLLMRQTNGAAAIVEDARGTLWIVNRWSGKTIAEVFDTLTEAKREASILSDLYRPNTPSPTWTVPVRGLSADDRFERWVQGD